MASCHETYRPFEVTVQRDDELATIMVSGELDLATVPQLSAAVAEHSDASFLVLDLTAVTFIDSTGVRVLIEADRACAGSGSRLAVLPGDGPVRRLLGLCKLDGRLALVTEHPSPAAQPDAGAMTTRPSSRASTADAHRHAELRSEPQGDDRSARRTRLRVVVTPIRRGAGVLRPGDRRGDRVHCCVGATPPEPTPTRGVPASPGLELRVATRAVRWGRR